MWFTSDHHFGHDRIRKYCSRPYTCVEHMDQDLIRRWNSVVGEHDQVYHLGDFCLGNETAAANYFVQLAGRIHVLYNPSHHDKRWLPPHIHALHRFTSRSGYRVKFELPIITLEIPQYGDRQALVLSHWPMDSWDRSHYSSWHLFGHCHGKVYHLKKAFDVGVDCNNFTPVSLEEVARRLG